MCGFTYLQKLATTEALNFDLDHTADKCTAILVYKDTGSLKRYVYLALKSCVLALCFVSFFQFQEWVIIYKSFTHVHTQTLLHLTFFFPLMDKFRISAIESDGLCRATPKAPHDP